MFIQLGQYMNNNAKDEEFNTHKSLSNSIIGRVFNLSLIPSIPYSGLLSLPNKPRLWLGVALNQNQTKLIFMLSVLHSHK